ncbi:hypothetical protein D9M68_930340 [compost metagenome]
MPAITPPMAPATPSAARPPKVIFGKCCDISIAGHHSTSSVPRHTLNSTMSRCGSSQTPKGTPTKPPRTKGQRMRLSKDRRTVSAAITCPVRAPNSASTAASCGSSVQAHTDIATMPKAKPDRPCTHPANTAPTIT